MGKGADFERKICRQLSEWWTGGKRDDVFWRSSNSGGRATVRDRKGKRTAGAYGDIAATDPIGKPLIDIFTIELKRGEYVKHPGDLLDCSGSSDCHPFLKAVRQAQEARKRARSKSWLLIVRRDRKHATIFFPVWTILDARGHYPRGPLAHARAELTAPPVFRYRLESKLDFMGMRLDKFLAAVSPKMLRKNK